MHIQLDLNHNDRDALLRHCQVFVPCSGDAREDARLTDTLEALASALVEPLRVVLIIRSVATTVLD